jgi:hypothetical protein
MPESCASGIVELSSVGFVADTRLSDFRVGGSTRLLQVDSLLSPRLNLIISQIRYVCAVRVASSTALIFSYLVSILVTTSEASHVPQLALSSCAIALRVYLVCRDKRSEDTQISGTCLYTSVGEEE